MESEILSVTSGRRDQPSVQAGPSATLDLIYAVFFLNGLERRPAEAPAWAIDLRDRAPEVVDAARALASDPAGHGKLVGAFGMAMEGGFVWDETPDRFLEELPRLAVRQRAWVDADEAPMMPETLQQLIREQDPEALAAEIASVLAPLWREVGRYWTNEGRALAETAAEEVRVRFTETGDVVRALPSHHFVQFEALAETLRGHVERGALYVVPLALASAGGFHLEAKVAAAVGFGLASENVHARTEAQVADVAKRAKALADPTRLMLLSLLARYATTSSLTVGDLARQLGVSQPTVSGHLKTLREAGLVQVERKGNRSLPRLDRDAVQEVLSALDDVLHRPELP